MRKARVTTYVALVLLSIKLLLNRNKPYIAANFSICSYALYILVTSYQLISQSVARSIETKLLALFPAVDRMTPDVARVRHSFVEGFKTLEDQTGMMQKSLGRMNAVSHELRIVSGIHGVSLGGKDRTRQRAFG